MRNYLKMIILLDKIHKTAYFDHMKKKTIILSLISLLLFSVIFAGVEISSSLTAAPSDGNIVLKWSASNETNLKYYVIERSTYKGSFAEIATVQSRSDMQYKYVDETAYKVSSSTLYIYRLKIVDNDGTVSYSGTASVNNNISGIKKTWGSIKALFR
jgi:hypothetical protein